MTAKTGKKPVEKPVISSIPVEDTGEAIKPPTIVPVPGHWVITHDVVPRLVWVKE